MLTNKPKRQQQLVSETALAAFGGGVLLGINDVQAVAIELHAAGLNVFPLPRGEKRPTWPGYQWSAFHTARLLEDDVEQAFGGAPCNIAIMTGRTSGNLFSVEAETPAEFGQLMETVYRAGLPLWAIRSARGGHVLLRCEDGEIANVTLTEARAAGLGEMEVHGHNRYIIGPESVHPDGPIYTLERQDSPEPPTVTFNELTAIFPDIPLKLATHRARQGQHEQPTFSERTQQLLDGEIATGERNSQLYTSARELLALGFDEQDTRAVLVEGAVKCGLPEREAHKTISSAIKGHRKDGNHETAHRRQGDRTGTAWWEAEQWARRQDWPGRTGTWNRAAFMAHVSRLKTEAPTATAGQSASWRCSAREGAELADMGAKAFSKATRRLVVVGILQVADRDATGYRYRFGTAVTFTVPASKVTTLYQSASNSVVRLDANHAAFGHTRRPTANGGWELRGLGPNAAPLLEALLNTDKPLMPTALARASGLTRGKVYTSLARLEKWLLAERVDEGWIVSVTPENVEERLDEVAFMCGTFEAARKRRKVHELERRHRLLALVLRARGMEATSD